MKFLLFRAIVCMMASPPSRGAWIEIYSILHIVSGEMSPPSRGAWIEIKKKIDKLLRFAVAPLAGGVD